MKKEEKLMEDVIFDAYTTPEYDREVAQEIERIGFNWGQSVEIAAGKKAGIDIKKYAHKKWSWEQMREIRMGQQFGIPIKYYHSELIPACIMKEIRLCLTNHISLKDFVKIVFNSDTIMGILDNKVRLDAERKASNDNQKGLAVETEIENDEESTIEVFQEGPKNMYELEITDFSEFNEGQIELIRQGFINKLDVFTYAKKELSVDIMNELYLAMREGVNMKKFIKTVFQCKSVDDIIKKEKTLMDLLTQEVQKKRRDTLAEYSEQLSLYNERKESALQNGKLFFEIPPVSKCIKSATVTLVDITGFNKQTIAYIREGFKKGLEVEAYAIPGLEPDVIYELYLTAKRKIGIKNFVKQAFNEDSPWELLTRVENTKTKERFRQLEARKIQEEDYKQRMASFLASKYYAETKGVKFEDKKPTRTRFIEPPFSLRKTLNVSSIDCERIRNQLAMQM